MKFCVIVPAYNAAVTLRTFLDALLKYVEHVVVIDDGSVDDTAQIAGEFAGRGVNLVSHGQNCGKGVALRTGFKWATQNNFEVAVAMDSDLQHSPADLPGMLEILDREKLDVLIGARLHDQKDMPVARRFGNWFSSWGTGNFCHQRVFDAQCGFRLYRLATCQTMFSELHLDRFVSESEILVRSAMNLLRIGFAPITVIYPGDETHQSHYRPWIDTFRILHMFTLELLRRTFTSSGRRELKELKRYVKSCSDWPRYYLLSGAGNKERMA